MDSPTAAGAAHDPASPYRAVPGPIDRVHFADEQRRRRRQSWRFTALAVLGVAITGIPVSIVVTPLLYALALVAARIVHFFAPVPWAWRLLSRSALVVFQALEAASTQGVLRALPTVLAGAAVLVLPGLVVMLGLWLALRVVFRRAGAGGVLLQLGARAPDPADFEERQLVNLVEELAVAAAIASPRVKLLDVSTVNAAAVGTSLEDATLVVTRGLLDRLGRDETQGVLGHLVGSVGNGDLRIVLTMFSVFQTFGLLALLLNTAFGPESRKVVAQLCRVALRPPSAADEAHAILALLERNATEFDTDDADRAVEDAGRLSQQLQASGASWLEKLGLAIWAMLNTVRLLSLWFAMFTVKLTVALGGGIVIFPVFAALWRARRRLADATAVELTRHPDGLASALQQFQQLDVDVPTVPSVIPLLVTWSRGPKHPASARMDHTWYLRFHPTLQDRLTRLAALGATSRAAAATPHLSFRAVGRSLVQMVRLGPLGILFLVLVPLALYLVPWLVLFTLGVYLVLMSLFLMILFRLVTLGL